MSLLLFWNQFAPSTSIDSGCSLYIYGQDVLSGGCDLFLGSIDFKNENISLVVDGHIDQVDSTPLFIFGRGTLSAGIPLYLKIRDPAVVEMVRYIKPEDLLYFSVANPHLAKLLAVSHGVTKFVAPEPGDPRYIKPIARGPRYTKPVAVEDRGMSGGEVVFALKFTQG